MSPLRACLTLLIVSSITMPLRVAYGSESRVYPAPAGIELFKGFAVVVDGKPSPVYPARIGPQDDQRRKQAMDDLRNTDKIYEIAGYSTFDVGGPATVIVTCPQDVHAVKVLPTAAGIGPQFSGRTITIPLKGPANLTVEVNGDSCHSLHLFANPIETDIPNPHDPNVIYFGPGVHNIGAEGIATRNGQTIYLAGGAVVRAAANIGKANPVVQLFGDNVTLRGRGILDGSLAPHVSRALLEIKGRNIHVEGIVVHDAPGWSMPTRGSNGVTIQNVKVFSHRKWGDGIDICNSQNVLIDGCFVRSLDDCIVVKTNETGQADRHILVQHCVIWNEVAHALSIGAEIREPVDDVVFTDCDVIHDVGFLWTMRVYHCDSAPVTNIRFEHIRVEQSKNLISLWIGNAEWSQDEARGHINDVVFSDITAVGDPASIELKGYDSQHGVEGVKFEDVTINGQRLTKSNMTTNPFVAGILILP